MGSGASTTPLLDEDLALLGSLEAKGAPGEGHSLPSAPALLAPELLGVPNPVVAALALGDGRLALQVCCRQACRAVLLAAAHRAADLATLGYQGLLRPRLQFACARGDVEPVWACLMQCRMQPDPGFKPFGANVADCDCGGAAVRAAVSLLLDEEGRATLEMAGCTPMLLAVAGRRRPLVSLLQAAGAVAPQFSPEVLKHDLLRAATTGDLQLVLLSLAAGLDVNAGYTFGWTLLMSAVVGNQPRVVRALLALNARAQAVDSAGKRALDLAILKGHSEVASILTHPNDTEPSEMW